MAEHDQRFNSFQEWVNKASSWLTRHPRYKPDGRFFAICFDAKGRQCSNGGDFQRANDEDTFPVRWLWPDQVGELAIASRNVAETLNGGFVRCGICNAQETTTDIDFAPDLYAALGIKQADYE